MKPIILLLGLLSIYNPLFSQVEDTNGPVLNWVTVTPETVNNNETITIQINTTDDISGVQYVGAYLGSPQNALFQNLNDTFTFIGDNTYETSVTINNWAASGEWYVSNIYLLDNAGNNTSPDTTEYFTVNSSTPDINAPVLNWITITPETVNNNDVVTVQINVTDDVSGVQYVGAYLGSPQNALFQNLNDTFTFIGNDTYETSFTINNWASSGEWYISNIYLLDNAGNDISPDISESFTVNSSTPDTNAPILNWVTVTPETVNNNDVITVQINVTDDVSGIQHVGAYLGSPQNPLFENLNDTFTFIGDNTYETTVTINNWAESGEWYISNIYLEDNARNNISPDTIEYFTVINTNTLSVDSIEKNQNKFTVYPNPTSDEVYFNLEELDSSLENEISIYNSIGEQLINIKSNLNSIDLSNLENGLYILVVSNSRTKYTSQIIKKNNR